MLAQEHRCRSWSTRSAPARCATLRRRSRARRRSAEAEVVTVRERGARQVLEEIGVHGEIAVTADPALLLKPEPLPADALKREGLDTAGRWSACRCASPAPPPPISASRLSRAAGRCRRLHGRPLRCRHRVRADGAEDARHPAVPRGRRRRCCARRARPCSRATIPPGSCSPSSALRLRGRHAPAFPDLREPAERAVRGAALRPQGRWLPGGSGDRACRRFSRSTPAG